MDGPIGQESWRRREIGGDEDQDAVQAGLPTEARKLVSGPTFALRWIVLACDRARRLVEAARVETQLARLSNLVMARDFWC